MARAREVYPVKHTKLVIFVIMVAAVVWGCVEELDQGGNRRPNVWFTRGPEPGQVIFQNSAEFEWMATDFDDDTVNGNNFSAVAGATTPAPVLTPIARPF